MLENLHYNVLYFNMIFTLSSICNKTLVQNLLYNAKE